MHDTSRAYEVREAIRAAIESGKYKVGDKLPSERDLVTEHHASRDTVRRAIQDLEVRGYVQRKAALGTVVLDWNKEAAQERNLLLDAIGTSRYEDSRPPQRSSEELIGRFTVRQSPDPNGTVLHADPPSLLPAQGAVAQWLEVAPQSLIMHRYRIIGTPDGIPYQAIESYYPASEFIDLFRRGVTDESLQHWISEHYEPRAKRISEDLSWLQSDGRGGPPFHLTSPNDALCIIRRQIRDADNRFMQFDYIEIPAKLCYLHYEYDARRRDEDDAEHAQ